MSELENISRTFLFELHSQLVWEFYTSYKLILTTKKLKLY